MTKAAARPPVTEAERKEILASSQETLLHNWWMFGVQPTKKNAPPFLRVKPGSPDSGLLFVKIIAPDTNQGEVMPKGADKLTQNSIDAIRRWILNGAPNN